MAQSLNDLIETLTSAGIVEEATLNTYKNDPAAPVTTAAEMLARLREANAITKFQAKAIEQGKTDGLLFGQYVVIERLGKGGMGAVFTARHRTMERMVALKVMAPDVMSNEKHVRRFQQEVRLAARLSHPNIVAAYDAGMANNLHYLVMEYVEGVDCSQLVKKLGPVKVKTAVSITRQAARGLFHAHRQQIVHRDIKPSNILVDLQGNAKILDMGIAGFLSELRESEDEDDLTKTGIIMGTVDYMSPEQAISSKQADERSDIYSLGATMFFLLTGERPFSGETPVQIILAHREGDLPPMSKFRDDVPRRVEAILRKMMARSPEDRFQTMQDVAKALGGSGSDDVIEIAPAHRETAPPSKSSLPRGRTGQATAANGLEADAFLERVRTGTSEKPSLVSDIDEGSRQSTTDGQIDVSSDTSPTGSVPDFMVKPSKRSQSPSSMKIALIIIMLGAAASGSYYYFIYLPAQNRSAGPEPVVVKPSGGQVTVSLSGHLTGAEILIDDEPYEVEELRQPVELLAGDHRIEARGAGIRPIRLDFRVAPNSEKTIALELVPAGSQNKPAQLDGQFSTR